MDYQVIANKLILRRLTFSIHEGSEVRTHGVCGAWDSPHFNVSAHLLERKCVSHLR